MQSRGGIGIKTMNCTDKTGLVVSATTVTDADELMINAKEAIQEITLVIPDEDDDSADGDDVIDADATEATEPTEGES